MQGRERATTVLAVADPRDVRGAIGIVCNDTPCRIGLWEASGPKLDAHDDRAFGPILFTQYTLSRRVMKLTAQMAPVGPVRAAGGAAVDPGGGQRRRVA